VPRATAATNVLPLAAALAVSERDQRGEFEGVGEVEATEFARRYLSYDQNAALDRPLKGDSCVGVVAQSVPSRGRTAREGYRALTAISGKMPYGFSEGAASEMRATASDVQRLALLTFENDEIRELVLGLPGPPEGHDAPSELWYWRRCLPVAQLVLTAAEHAGYENVRLVLGQFQDETDDQPFRHAWLELSDGTIVDPTSAQMGGPVCAIVATGDHEYGYYHSRASWREGDPD
jgi:hypothetical protein